MEDWSGEFKNDTYAYSLKNKNVTYPTSSKNKVEIYESLETKSFELAKSLLEDVEPHLKDISKVKITTVKPPQFYTILPILRVAGIAASIIVFLFLLKKIGVI